MRRISVVIVLVGVLILGAILIEKRGGETAPERPSFNTTRLECMPVKYWVFEGRWVEKEEPRVWWYCIKPEEYERFDGYAFKPTSNSTKLQEALQKLNSMLSELDSYGGMMINEETGTIFIYLISEEDKKKVREALKEYEGKVNVVFLKGKYKFKDLEAWAKKLVNESAQTGIEITSIDADEAHNTLTIGLAEVTDKKLEALGKLLDKLGIPRGAVRVERVVYVTPQ
ncbi:hypothetical protein [Pyrococcus kukulkanii]|uniref:Uncharacterized protein n=1 Tax=Pyrococcus kukulkanii TaxID=1609559 RepID=A0ABV4T1S7_9EURY